MRSESINILLLESAFLHSPRSWAFSLYSFDDVVEKEEKRGPSPAHTPNHRVHMGYARHQSSTYFRAEKDLFSVHDEDRMYRKQVYFEVQGQKNEKQVCCCTVSGKKVVCG
jgi:hypothetical protein